MRRAHMNLKPLLRLSLVLGMDMCIKLKVPGREATLIVNLLSGKSEECPLAEQYYDVPLQIRSPFI